MSVFIGDKGSCYFYTANTLAEYINRIGINKAKKRLYFRGMSNESYDLSPSLNRPIKGDPAKRKWHTKESRLVEFAQQRLPNDFSKPTPVLMLSSMQHFGIPTRMLDITGNALVGLYFACQNSEKGHNGQVVVFDGMPVSAYNPFANIIADTYRLTNNAITSVKNYRYSFYHQPYAAALIYPDWENEIGIDPYIDSLLKPMIVDVGAVNRRQINQDGKFIIFPNRIHKYEDNKSIITNEIVTLDKVSELVQAIITIPNEKKDRILEQLKLVGITKEFLFPDNTEIVCDGIKESISMEALLI